MLFGTLPGIVRCRAPTVEAPRGGRGSRREVDCAPPCQQLIVPRWQIESQYQEYSEVPATGMRTCCCAHKRGALGANRTEERQKEHEGASWSPLHFFYVFQLSAPPLLVFSSMQRAIWCTTLLINEICNRQRDYVHHLQRNKK